MQKKDLTLKYKKLVNKINHHNLEPQKNTKY